MPDGSQCGPNLKFTKKWLIQNTGKLAWSDDNFPVKLVCVAGNISTLNQDIVNVFEAPVDSTIEVAVNLVSPSQPGEYYTEWAFVCKDFQFGPRLWCAIEVVKNQVSKFNNHYFLRMRQKTKTKTAKLCNIFCCTNIFRVLSIRRIMINFISFKRLKTSSLIKEMFNKRIVCNNVIFFVGVKGLRHN